MKEKHILYAALILLALVSYYSFFEFGKNQEKPPYLGPPLLFLDYRDVKRIQIKTSEGKELICERNRGEWNLIKGNKVEKWRSKIADFVSYLISAVEIDRFAVKSSQLGKFGLEDPPYKITVTDVTDKTYQLMIGDDTPVRTCVYVKFVDYPEVIIVGALLNWELSKISSLFSPIKEKV